MIYYHGSYDALAVGTVLRPREDYEKEWGKTDFYEALEHYRPEEFLPHAKAVFMCDNPDDLDSAGGATNWVLHVKPLTPRIERHDLNWSSEVSMLISEGFAIESDEVKQASLNYWNGVAHPNESLWEYLTEAAVVIKVEEF